MWRVLLWGLLVAAPLGCSDGGEPDPVTPNPDASVREGHASTAGGGGVVASAGFRLVLNVGAPRPVGRTQSSQHRLLLGPLAPEAQRGGAR